MPVSGLVVSLSNNAEARAQALEAIEQEPRLECGVIESNRMAVVVDSTSADEDKELWAWLQGLDGVVFVDVVMVGFEDNPTSQDSTQVQGTHLEAMPPTSKGT